MLRTLHAWHAYQAPGAVVLRLHCVLSYGSRRGEQPWGADVRRKLQIEVVGAEIEGVKRGALRERHRLCVFRWQMQRASQRISAVFV